MFADNTIVESIVWLVIGFIPTYGAMELAWRVAKRRMKEGNRRRRRTTTTQERVAGSTVIPAAERN
jgi:hypothetical protein